MRTDSVVLDANILIRAVLGQRVRTLLEKHVETWTFFVPTVAFDEAECHLAALVVSRGGDPERALRFLLAMKELLDLVPTEVFAHFGVEARTRMSRRDPDDWPILACALATGSPIWTEDTDFFGCGVATWTTDRIERLFEQ